MNAGLHSVEKRVDAVTASSALFTSLLCCAVALIDGMDVLSISYSADSLSKQFGWGPAQIGFLLSAGLAGMTLGSIFFSPLADMIGRKASVIIALTIVTAAMALTSLARSHGELAITRLVTGIGIGAITSNIISLVFETSPQEKRAFAVGILGTGFPLGAALAGSTASWLMNAHHDWRSIFLTDAILSALMIPVLALWLPESPTFKGMSPLHSRRANSAATVRWQIAALSRIGRQFAGPALVWALVYLLFMTSFYFVLTWQAKLLVQIGLSSADGIRFSSLVTYGGVAGNLTAGLLTRRLGMRACAIVMIIIMTGLIGILPWLVHTRYVNLFALSLGWTMFASIIMLYTLTSAAFPVEARSTCLGVSLGVGRIGSILGPYVAGLLLQAGLSVESLCELLAAPAAVAAMLLAIARIRLFAQAPLSASPLSK